MTRREGRVDVSHMDNLSGPLLRRVRHEDRQGIEALFVAAADAWRTEDTVSLMTLYDLPIYAGTRGVMPVLHDARDICQITQNRPRASSESVRDRSGKFQERSG